MSNKTPRGKNIMWAAAFSCTPHVHTVVAVLANFFQRWTGGLFYLLAEPICNGNRKIIHYLLEFPNLISLKILLDEFSTPHIALLQVFFPFVYYDYSYLTCNSWDYKQCPVSYFVSTRYYFASDLFFTWSLLYSTCVDKWYRERKINHINPQKLTQRCK